MAVPETRALRSSEVIQVTRATGVPDGPRVQQRSSDIAATILVFSLLQEWFPEHGGKLRPPSEMIPGFK